MSDVYMSCEEDGLYMPEVECDACAEYLELLDSKMDAFSIGNGLVLNDNILSAERNPSNTYTKQEVDELIDTGGEFTAGAGITIANHEISADRNPNNTYTKAEVDAMITGTGGALPVGTIIHSTSNVAPSIEGNWVKIFSLSDGMQWDAETSTGFYIAVFSSHDGPVMTVVVPGLHESGATVDDVSLHIDFGSSASIKHMIFIANGNHYNLKYASGFTDEFEFRVRNIYGDTIQFDTNGIFPRTDRGATMSEWTNGMCRFRGLVFSCTKPLYYWKRIS